jgi:uncharacterized protein YbjT (DUF2867 family)
VSRTAFVAGATGYTGRAVVEELRRRGLETVAHVRPGSSSLETLGPRFEALGARVDTTPWEPEAMRATLAGLRPTVVFALLGTTAKRAKGEGMESEEAYERVDYGLTALLIDAAAALPEPPRFLYLSSLGAEPGTKNAYLAARVKAEAKLRESGLPHTVARPSFVTGSDREESRPMERTAAVVADAALAFAGLLGATSLRDRYSSLAAAALAKALVAAGLDPACDGRVLDAARLRRLT